MTPHSNDAAVLQNQWCKVGVATLSIEFHNTRVVLCAVSIGVGNGTQREQETDRGGGGIGNGAEGEGWHYTAYDVLRKQLDWLAVE